MIESGEIYMTSNVQDDPHIGPAGKAEKLEFLLSVPIRSKEKVIGVIHFSNRKSGIPEPQEIDFLHFERGDFAGPEFVCPPHIEEAGIEAIRQGLTRYVPGPGLPELREAVAEEMTRRGRPTTTDEVIINLGAKFGLTTTILTFVEEGDLGENKGHPRGLGDAPYF